MSVLIIVAVVWGKSSFLRRVHSQIAFLVAVANAIYSASTNEVATVACFFKDYDTDSPSTSKMRLLVDH